MKEFLVLFLALLVAGVMSLFATQLLKPAAKTTSISQSAGYLPTVTYTAPVKSSPGLVPPPPAVPILTTGTTPQ